MNQDSLSTLVRAFSFAMVAVTILFLINNVLIFWFDWPGMFRLFGQWGWPGFDAPDAHSPPVTPDGRRDGRLLGVRFYRLSLVSAAAPPPAGTR